MLTQPLLQQLHELRLRGMAAAFEQQLTTSTSNQMSFDERLGLLIQNEILERQSYRLRQRLRWAKLTQEAAIVIQHSGTGTAGILAPLIPHL